MKVQPENQPSAAAPEAPQVTAAKAARASSRKPKEPAKRGKKDRVDLSGPVSDRLQAEKSKRDQQVASIKERLEAGTYRVDSREVAQKMLCNSGKRSRGSR